MVDDFHNPEESTFELISRLRKGVRKDSQSQDEELFETPHDRGNQSSQSGNEPTAPPNGGNTSSPFHGGNHDAPLTPPRGSNGAPIYHRGNRGVPPSRRARTAGPARRNVNGAAASHSRGNNGVASPHPQGNNGVVSPHPMGNHNQPSPQHPMNNREASPPPAHRNNTAPPPHGGSNNNAFPQQSRGNSNMSHEHYDSDTRDFPPQPQQRDGGSNTAPPYRRERRESAHPGPQPRGNHGSHDTKPSFKRTRPASPEGENEHELTFSNLRSNPGQVLRHNLSKIALGGVALVLFGFFIFGVTSLFNNAFGHSAPSTPTDIDAATYLDQGSAYENASEHDSSSIYAEYDEDGNAQDDNQDVENQLDYAPPATTFSAPFSRYTIATVIQPYLEDISYDLGLEFEEGQWPYVVLDVATEAYYAYRDVVEDGIDWRQNVITFSELAFYYSGWGVMFPPPDYDGNDAEPEEDSLPESSPPANAAHTPPANNATHPPAQPPQTQGVFLDFSLEHGGRRADFTVPFISNQGLIDLLVMDLQLRLVVNDPTNFPFNEAAMVAWANHIAETYRQNGLATAEAHLRSNISALERADIASQQTPHTRGEMAESFYSVSLHHFVPAGAAYTLPTLTFRSQAVRDWFERNFATVLHSATPYTYLLGNHAPWFALEARLNNLSEAAAIDYMIARSVEAAHRSGWTSASAGDFW